MTDDLVKTLRTKNGIIDWPERNKCADRIEELEDDVKHEKEYLAEAEDLISQHYERAVKAEKRIKELESALREIYHLPPEHGPVPGAILNIVSRALGEEP